MLGRFGMQIPDREPRAIELRRGFQRLLEKRQRRRWRFRDQPLHVQLEHLGRRRQAIVGRRDGADEARICCPSAPNTPNRSDERTARFDFRKQPARVEPHDAGARHDLIALHRDGAADHERRAERLADPDRRGAAQRCARGQLQAIERLQALLAIDDDLARGGERLAEQDRGAFAHPREARLPASGSRMAGR